MRSLLLVILLFSSFFITSQENQNILGNHGNALTVASSATRSSYGASTRFVNPPRNVEGSIYLFDEWNNKGAFYTNDKNSFILENININLKSSSIVTRFGTRLDSLLTLDNDNIDFVRINLSQFKVVNIKGNKKIVEQLYTNSDKSVYKYVNVKLREGSSNPMVNRKSDRYIRQIKYYFDTNGNITEFRLKKKSIMRVFAENSEDKRKILQFYEKRKLSFGKLKDLIYWLNEEKY